MPMNPKKILAATFVMTMLTTALSGCLGPVDEQENGQTPELEEWNVFYISSEADLPACDDAHEGRLYFVSGPQSFFACDSGYWTEIEIKGQDGQQGTEGPEGPQGDQGPAGPQGDQGPVGPQGAQGPQGVQGPSGTPGQDGTSFTVIGTVEDTSDLGEIYIGDAGDAFLVNSTVHIHVWSGSEWIDLGDMSGPPGSPGPAGADGADGAQGPAGPQGPAGADGADGAQGPVGPQGPAGADGADGADGSDGAQGPAGTMPVVMEMTITVSGMKYYVNGIQQADITLYRGFTYTFDLSSSSLNYHPFRLGTSANGNQYTSGTNTANQILTFTVPLDAPDDLYYYCQSHNNMGGTIDIESLGSVES